jgi:hypothetical protein
MSKGLPGLAFLPLAAALGCSDGGSGGTPDAGVPAAAIVEVDVGHRLTAAALQAVELAPAWLAADLRANLIGLDDALQDALAAVLLDFPDPAGRDEVAFCLAHVSPTHLADADFRPGLIADNVESLLEIDAVVAYADIVDHGDPAAGGDYWSTISYRTAADGETVEEVELDRDTYYWHIVFPVIEDEPPRYINPVNGGGTDPPTGRFWRDYLFFEAGPGYEPLSSYLDGQGLLWKGRPYDKDDNGAIGDIIRWVQDSMEFGSDAERPIQPVRIYAKHLGRCGEHGDLTTAAARAALIPNVNVSAWANDHVWNEFWDRRWVQWEPVNTYVEHYYYYADADKNYYRSGLGVDNDCDGEVDEGCELADPEADGDDDGYTRGEGDCDDGNADVNPGADEIPGDLIDNDCDGVADDGADTADADGDGFSIADGDCNDASAAVHPGADEETPSNNRNFAVSAWRGDGKVGTVSERYAGTFTLEVEVTDADGAPLDGATVLIAGYSTVYPDDPGILIATWAATDSAGRATFELGEANEYYGRVESALGDFPEAANTVKQLFEDWPVKGEVRAWDVQLEAAFEPWPFEVAAGAAAGPWSLRASLAVDQGFVRAANFLTGALFRDPDDGAARMDVFVVDQAGYDALAAGEPFEALHAAPASAGGELEIGLPDTGGPFYLVAASSAGGGIVADGRLEAAVSLDGEVLAEGGLDATLLPGDFRALKIELIEP